MLAASTQETGIEKKTRKSCSNFAKELEMPHGTKEIYKAKESCRKNSVILEGKNLLQRLSITKDSNNNNSKMCEGFHGKKVDRTSSLFRYFNSKNLENLYGYAISQESEGHHYGTSVCSDVYSKDKAS